MFAHTLGTVLFILDPLTRFIFFIISFIEKAQETCKEKKAMTLIPLEDSRKTY